MIPNHRSIRYFLEEVGWSGRSGVLEINSGGASSGRILCDYLCRFSGCSHNSGVLLFYPFSPGLFSPILMPSLIATVGIVPSNWLCIRDIFFNVIFRACSRGLSQNSPSLGSRICIFTKLTRWFWPAARIGNHWCSGKLNHLSNSDKLIPELLGKQKKWHLHLRAAAAFEGILHVIHSSVYLIDQVS